MDLSKLTLYEKLNIAQHPKTTSETLALLANDKYWVRKHVALNPNTPQYIKEYLIAREFMEDYGSK